MISKQDDPKFASNPENSENQSVGRSNNTRDFQHPPGQNPVGYFVPFQSDDESEIDLLQIWRILWQRRWLMMGLPFIVSVLTALYTLTLSDVYRGNVLLAPVALEESNRSLLGDIGGLASLAGISVPAGNDTDENLAVLRSREFLWRYIENRNLMPLIFSEDWNESTGKWANDDAERQPTLWDAYRKFNEEVLGVSTDPATGLVNLTVEWTDPKLAADWANDLISRLNEYLRTQAIDRSTKNLEYLNSELERSPVAEMRETLYQLIAKEQRIKMLANTQPEFAFRIIDRAVIPDRKVRPKRAVIVILTGLTTGLLIALFVLIQHAIRRNSPNTNE